MKKLIISVVFLLCLAISSHAQKKDGYVVITSKEIKNSADWFRVVDALAKRHKATVLLYDKKPTELLEELRRLTPRYVAIVEKPENLNRDYVMEGHRMSRIIDKDIYADYLWGIITGYDAEAAMKMVRNSEKPYLLKTALTSTGEMSDGSWFNQFAFVSDGKPGEWGEKKSGEKSVTKYQLNKWEILNKWVEKYREIDPDFIISSAHATEENLEMPFSVGNIKSSGGKLYADFMTPDTLPGTTHPRVYFPAGNCLIGNIDNTRESMAVAWLSGGGVTSMVGYVVTTWFGRNGWGGLKYFASSWGRLTLAEAIYLNQQDMLRIEADWNPKILEINYPFSEISFGEDDDLNKLFSEKVGGKPTKEQKGFIHDRDVVVFYGDPAWDVRVQSKDLGYSVKSSIKGNRCILTITTNDNFDKNMMQGGKIKQIHVSDIPFCYIFPKRLSNPTLSEGQPWDVTLADDFLFVNNCDFEKNKTYQISIDLN